jgi:hypothetical protein
MAVRPGFACPFLFEKALSGPPSDPAALDLTACKCLGKACRWWVKDEKEPLTPEGGECAVAWVSRELVSSGGRS